MTKPIPMILHCPKCGEQHIDGTDTVFDHFDVPMEPESEDGKAVIAEMQVWERTHTAWHNPPHCSHLCHGCGHIWRPADVPTEGVKAIQTRGQNDGLITNQAARDAALWRHLENQMGHVQNGSDTTVALFQDDATYTYHVRVGKTTHYGQDLFEALMKHPKVEY